MFSGKFLFINMLQEFYQIMTKVNLFILKSKWFSDFVSRIMKCSL